jgi:hypothetical protein
MLKGFEREGFAPRSQGRWVVAGNRQVDWIAEAIRADLRRSWPVVVCPSSGVTEFRFDHLVEALAAGVPGQDTLVVPAVSELGWPVAWEQLAAVVSYYRPQLVIDAEYARYARSPQSELISARAAWHQRERRVASAHWVWRWGLGFPPPAPQRQDVASLAVSFRQALDQTAGVQLCHPTDPGTGIVCFRVAPWNAFEASEILIESHGLRFGVVSEGDTGESWLRASFGPGQTQAMVLAAAGAVLELAARTPALKLVH